jgi:hypothetical protein
VIECDAQRAQNEAIGIPAAKALDQVDLVRGIGSGRVQDQTETSSFCDFLDRTHHLDVDRVRDVSHSECELHRSARFQ